MIKGIKYSAASAAILLAMSGIAHAEVAKIIGLNGSAIVERGGYRYVAQEGMLLNEGDIVRSLEGSKVNLKYDSCQGAVAATMQVSISAKNQCATQTVAASKKDLKPLPKSAHKIQRIDENLSRADCKACAVKLDPVGNATSLGKVALASNTGTAGAVAAVGSGASNLGTLGKVAAGVLPLLLLAGGSSNGGSGSSVAATGTGSGTNGGTGGGTSGGTGGGTSGGTGGGTSGGTGGGTSGGTGGGTSGGTGGGTSGGTGGGTSGGTGGGTSGGTGGGTSGGTGGGTSGGTGGGTNPSNQPISP